jgi:hypothetical protein
MTIQKYAACDPLEHAHDTIPGISSTFRTFSHGDINADATLRSPCGEDSIEVRRHMTEHNDSHILQTVHARPTSRFAASSSSCCSRVGEKEPDRASSDASYCSSGNAKCVYVCEVCI